jgi:hypothetical protein
MALYKVGNYIRLRFDCGIGSLNSLGYRSYGIENPDKHWFKILEVRTGYGVIYDIQTPKKICSVYQKDVRQFCPDYESIPRDSSNYHL